MKIHLRLPALADLRSTSLLAVWGTLAMGLGIMTWPNEALAWTGWPLAYVSSNDGILVIDTGDKKVVDTISGPSSPAGAVAFQNPSALVSRYSGWEPSLCND